MGKMGKTILNLNSNRFYQNFTIAVFIFFVLFLHQGCFFYQEPGTTPILNYKVLESFPHDPEAFTQGLVWENGYLYEGTGLYGNSSLRKIDLKSGEVLKRHNLSDIYFGEGITMFQDKIYQLTWQEQTGFIYDLKTFELLDTFYYSYEGWGITNDGKNLIISDGTPVIRFLDPENMEEISKITVYDNLFLIHNINELEYINGYIYANIWQTSKIAVIKPESGKVIAYLDLGDILENIATEKPIDVLNGIAYDKQNEYFFVTGKLWPKVFQIKIDKNIKEHNK